jgi:hypothetical protein
MRVVVVVVIAVAVVVVVVVVAVVRILNAHSCSGRYCLPIVRRTLVNMMLTLIIVDTTSCYCNFISEVTLTLL